MQTEPTVSIPIGFRHHRFEPAPSVDMLWRQDGHRVTAFIAPLCGGGSIIVLKGTLGLKATISWGKGKNREVYFLDDDSARECWRRALTHNPTAYLCPEARTTIAQA